MGSFGKTFTFKGKMRKDHACAAILAMGVGSVATAQSADPDASEAAARAALSVLSIAATPNETMSSFSFLRAAGDTKSLRSTQLRGGYHPLDNGLYLEGLVAYQKYNPVLFFPEIAPGVDVDVTWASVAATFGVGWEFPLKNDWRIRPLGHVSIGHVTADASIIDFPLLPVNSGSADSVDGNLNALGLGSSVAVFKEAQIGLWQAEYRLRQTFLEFHPIDEPQAGGAKASSNQTTLFSRHRYPLKDVRFFNLATLLVLDAGLVYYHGDAAKVLDTDWLATAGVGIEIDTSRAGIPSVQAGRIMLNGVIAEDFDGFSIGLGLRF
ncbi:MULTISPECIES: autotransporter domain-containing protein [unclassified Ruegeria]|uniref:autotransporter domain-containing protein n=1 Tax=unclassified Ruegeria TaxID=2625375 RepID=UPI001487A2CE|nr:MULTISPECIES: autotransporter domain-containing protein [unclassified Ruegeria]